MIGPHRGETPKQQSPPTFGDLMKGDFVDFSWVKQLADQTNQQEIDRQEQKKRELEDQVTIAKATCPFVEKLHVVISGAAEEFNKHCMFPKLKVDASRLYKHSKTSSEPGSEPDEVAYFTFNRLGYMFGIRGVNGLVEFIQIPMGEFIGKTVKLHELQTSSTKRLVGEIDPESKRIRWMLDQNPMDGPAIVSLCQKFFIELIETTNAEEAKAK